MKKTLTEELPSSGNRECAHEWQLIQGETNTPGYHMAVCKKSGCSASKLVEKPRVQENAAQKKILLG